MNKEELRYQIALTLVPSIGPIQARILIEKFGSAANIFKASIVDLAETEGIGSIRARSLQSFSDFSSVEQEISFIEKYAIKPLFLTDPCYPQRLLNCYDPPAMLYYKGNADLNTARVLSIVGTRKNTSYGKQQAELLVKGLADYNVLIISGLAYGIDGIAHKTSLGGGLPTVGVLAHGLDIIYPLQHASLARKMLEKGGLLTEFTSKNKPNKYHFPARNRIVAGMSDATIIIETGLKGGSMITAEIANSYNRDVFAFPGKTTDNKSAGCNYLIKNNNAILLTDTEQLLNWLGWDDTATIKTKAPSDHQEIAVFSLDERKVISILKGKEQVCLEEMIQKSDLPPGTLAAIILNLEMQELVTTMPGKMYKLMGSSAPVL